MQFDAGLTGSAASLAREHRDVLARLPVTIQAFILVELQKWPTLFAAEQRYQRALLEHLSQLPGAVLTQAASSIAAIERQAGCDKIARGDPRRFQDEAQALLRKSRLVPVWRKEVDGFFQTIDPTLEAQLYPADAPRRVVVQLYASNIAVQTGNLWSRFKGTGVRVPLKLEEQASEAFLKALFGGAVNDGKGLALFSAASAMSGFDALDAWIVESHEELHNLCDDGIARRHELRPRPIEMRWTGNSSFTGLSYDRLRAYRDELTRALYRKIQSGVESPQAFAAYARSLKIAPDAGTFPHSADLLQAFVRDVLLTGNGTLFVNNTFVEWAAVQALRRAQPRILVTRFGVRDKLKPFSSLLLFSQPRASDQIPILEDPVGSFIDVEQLSYYVWLNAEKSPAYRRKTLYLFLAEGTEEMLAIRSDVPVMQSAVPANVSLADVYATMAQWLAIPLQGLTGSPIPSLVG